MPSAETLLPEPTQNEKSPDFTYHIRWRWIFIGFGLLFFAFLLTPAATFYYTYFQEKRSRNIDRPPVASSKSSKKQSNAPAKKPGSGNSGTINYQPSEVRPATAVMMQSAPIVPEIRPTPPAPEKEQKNILRKIIDWFIGLFKKKKPPVVNKPANVTGLALNKETVILPCPPGQFPENGTGCSDDMTIKVSASAVNPTGNSELTYNYTVSSGRIVGQGANVVWDLSSARTGTFTITAGVDNGVPNGATLTKTITVRECSCEKIKSNCPSIGVSSPSSLTEPGEAMNFTANVNGLRPEMTFNWSVSAGEFSGQGTPFISVIAPSDGVSAITATVEIGGLEPGCNPTASANGSISAAPPEKGIIKGKVIDKNKAVRPGIEVFLFDTAGNLIKSTRTGADGTYTFSDVPFGNYVIEVQLDGQTKRIPVLLSAPFMSNVDIGFSPTSPTPTPASSPVEFPTPAESPTPSPSPSPTIEANSSPSPSPTVSENNAKNDLVEVKFPQRVLPETEQEISCSIEQTDVYRTPSNSISVNVNTGNIVIHSETFPTILNRCKNCRIFAKPRLTDLEGLVIIKAPETPEMEYNGTRLSWVWKVKTTLKEGETARFRIQLDFELRSDTDSEPLPDYWKDSLIPIPVGLPGWIKAATPISACLGLIGIVGGAIPRKRRRDDMESPDDLPPAEPEDEVHSTIYAPAKAKTGSSFLVQVFAHLPEETDEIEKAAAQKSRDAVQQDTTILDETVKRGTKLIFELRMPGMNVDEPIQTLTWKGMFLRAGFIISVPKDYPLGESFGKVIVSANSVPIGRLEITVEIVSSSADHSNEEQTVRGKMSRYQMAFISYASNDRPEVLKRVQMLKAQRIPFFQDMVSLYPGDRWNDKIYKNIDRCDVLFLFWSEAAKNSEWVKKEVLYAYHLQHGQETAPPDIIPIPLEGPPPVLPPNELNFLHFNDEFIYLIYAAEAEQKARRD